jgi:hypothetical protein
MGLAITSGCNDVLFERPCPAFFVRGASGCVLAEERVADLARTFRDGQLARINAAPFQQLFGSSIRRNVWVSPIELPDGRTAADLYRTIDPERDVVLDGAFPVGTIIVHEAVDQQEGHAIQIRREEAWDDGHGRHWWFGKYFDNGTLDDNPCSPCTDCHSLELRGGSDGLWGVPRGAL